MNTLIETRNSYAAKCEALKVARNQQIEEQVQAYRAQLEAAMPTTEIEKLQAVVDSLDKVIAYEASVEPQHIGATTQVNVAGAARVGMPGISIPERR